MKKLIVAGLLIIAVSAKASNEKFIKSSVKNVTVFTQGAQVFRTAPVSLSPGITELVFSGLSPNMNPASIQAGGKGNFIILEVKHNIKYPEPPKTTEGTLPKEILREIKIIEDSLIELDLSGKNSVKRKARSSWKKI